MFLLSRLYKTCNGLVKKKLVMNIYLRFSGFWDGVCLNYIQVFDFGFLFETLSCFMIDR